MRLLRLDLEKYGAFEGRTLAFDPEARLHVVFGPNEAGKSSALSAVGDLLFGFGARTDYAFRHAQSELRLGAAIASSAGAGLSFRRRKGKSGTLIGADDKPLRDDLLAPFLGQLTRETFGRAFGLSSESLRAGAEDLLSAEGGGGGLFAAASGLRGVETLRRALDEQADALFSPQARTRPFNDLARRVDAARATMREHELGATQWKRLNDDIEALEERHRALEDERGGFAAERARLERLSRAHGAAVALERGRRALLDFGEAPDISPDLRRDLTERLDARDEAERGRARAREACGAAEDDFGRIALDEPALAAAVEIEALVRASGAFAKTSEDLPRVGREAEEVEEAVGRLARRLGLGDGASIEAAMPSDAARNELAALLRDGAEIVRDRRAAEAAVQRERADLERLGAARSAEDALDPRPLREAFAALAPRLRSLDRRLELASELAREADLITDAAARLSPAVSDLGRLAARPLPSSEWIARMRREQDRLALEAARAGDLAKARDEEARKADVELANLGSDGPIASPDTIRAARAAREAAWRPLKASLAGGPPASDVAPYEKSVAEADRLADRLAEDARRAAREAELRRRLAEIARERAQASADRESLDARTAVFVEGWRAEWRGFGVDPGEPDEMESWRKSFCGLLERRDALGRREGALAALDALAASIAPELSAIASAAGLAEADARDAAGLGARLEARLDALSARFQEGAARAVQIADAARRLQAAESDALALAEREREWRERWSVAVPRLGLAPDAPFEAVDAALRAWSEAPGLIAKRDDLSRRVRGMTRDADGFRDRVAALVSAFAPECSDLPAQTAAERLGRRLTAALSAQGLREDAGRRREQAAAALSAAERALVRAGEALEMAAIGVGPVAELRALLPRIEERSRLARTVEERRDQLLTAGGAADEQGLLAELGGFDADAAPAAIERLKADEGRADRDAQQAWAELHAARERRDALGGAEAERAATQARAAGAALHEMAREWSVAKLASLLLGAAIDRARAEDRSPTLERAGALFAMLTGDAFSGFAENYEDDALVLFGRRSSGEVVPVRGMSEGARDQFYLALRLAALEDYASRAEPAPFIGDDLFASFDDERTAHGLMALAEIGATVQPILFTHHRAVVETARRTLGSKADVIEIERADAGDGAAA